MVDLEVNAGPAPPVRIVAEPEVPGGRVGWPAALKRLAGWAFQVGLAAACVAGLVAAGRANGWTLPKASALRGVAAPMADDWCEEHGVPESSCAECSRPKPEGAAGGKPNWCRVHGVHDCPLEWPEIAQMAEPGPARDADRDLAARALAFTPRAENNRKCVLHRRLVQLESQEVADRLGVAVRPAFRSAVAESVTAPGEVEYVPTRVARLAPRAKGSVRLVLKEVGDRVRRGEAVAVVDAAEVGRAKADYSQALSQLALRRQSASGLAAGGPSVAGKELQAAESAVEEAQVRLLTAEQALLNLGLPTPAVGPADSPAEIARRMQSLGLPEALAGRFTGPGASSNLISVTAPFDGEVVARDAAAGEAADPARPLMTIADTSQMRLTLRVRLEDVGKVRRGQEVRFRHAGHAGKTEWDTGAVAWVGPAADEKTRTVPVRVELPAPEDRHPANTYGVAEVVVREEASAVVVPAAALHWEGCCHVVFVRDRDYDRPGSPKLFHVRTVRPAARAETPGGPVVEIAAGLRPGELVAVGGSGVLRSQLLKNNLGAGCDCCAGK